MSDILSGIHVINPFGVVVLVILWIVLFKFFAHGLVILLRHEPLIGWAIGPFGITVMFLREPSLLYIWLDVLCPAFVSGCVLYLGLFTSLSPIVLPHHLWFEALVIVCGVLCTSTGDLVNALRDLRHPLWGEARILRSVHLLHSTWTKIHFTSFGSSYLSDYFGSSPAELLQAL